MRIGYIVSQYPGVSHTFIQREVLGLRNLGWDITTISIRRPHQRELLTPTDKAEAQSTHVVVPPSPLTLLAALVRPLLYSPGLFLRSMRAAWRIRRPGIKGTIWAFFYFLEALLVHRLCRKENIKHLHAHFANVAADVALIATCLNQGTYSFTMHGPTEFFDIAEHRLAQKAAAAKFIICISDFCRSQMMSLLPPEQWHKLDVVHCGIDPEQFHHPRTRRDPADESPFTILCVARLATVKGHAVLLEAVAELLIRGHFLTVLFAGDGPLRHSLERRADVLGIADRIRFLGNVGQDVIHELFTKADVFVLPSFAEGVPVVLMEAMAARCPVVATRIAGIPELIDHGTSGLVVPPGRADLLANAIERILVHQNAAERMAEVACDKIKREFNLHKVAPQLANIFRRYLDPIPARTPVTNPRTRALDHRLAEEPPIRPTRQLQEPVETADANNPHDFPRGAA